MPRTPRVGRLKVERVRELAEHVDQLLDLGVACSQR